jgi:hypothetical protein
MNQREYLRIKRRIEDECKQKLDALELVWQMTNQQDEKGAEDRSGIKRGALLAAIARVVGTFGHDFSAEQVLAKLKVTDPEIGEKAKASSVSSALNRMVGQEIEVKIRGVGRTPSIYTLKKSELKVVGS